VRWVCRSTPSVFLSTQHSQRSYRRYAGSVAVNSIFFAYVYVVVEPQHYAVATAGIYASYHTGNFLASVLASVLVRHTAVARHLVTLFYLSWVSTSIACIVFVALVPKPIFAPPVSIFAILRGRSTAIDGQEQANVVHGGDLDRKFGFRAVVRELRSVYASRDVKLASLWMVLGNGSTGIGINIFQVSAVRPYRPQVGVGATDVTRHQMQRRFLLDIIVC
jgi:hypothetical protein